jgi:hypothetical protein
MSEQEQIKAFVTDIQRVVDRYRSEFNLTLASAIGSLEIVKLELWKEHADDAEREN